MGEKELSPEQSPCVHVVHCCGNRHEPPVPESTRDVIGAIFVVVTIFVFGFMAGMWFMM